MIFKNYFCFKIIMGFTTVYGFKYFHLIQMIYKFLYGFNELFLFNNNRSFAHSFFCFIIFKHIFLTHRVNPNRHYHTESVYIWEQEVIHYIFKTSRTDVSSANSGWYHIQEQKLEEILWFQVTISFIMSIICLHKDLSFQITILKTNKLYQVFPLNDY